MAYLWPSVCLSHCHWASNRSCVWTKPLNVVHRGSHAKDAGHPAGATAMALFSRWVDGPPSVGAYRHGRLDNSIWTLASTCIGASRNVDEKAGRVWETQRKTERETKRKRDRQAQTETDCVKTVLRRIPSRTREMVIHECSALCHHWHSLGRWHKTPVQQLPGVPQVMVLYMQDLHSSIAGCEIGKTESGQRPPSRCLPQRIRDSRSQKANVGLSVGLQISSTWQPVKNWW